jgi:hypothetical protein
VTDQAAPSASRKYVILEQTEFAGGTPDLFWALMSTVEATSVEAAIKTFVAESPAWEGGTLVAIPARSWAPKTVKVETQKTVTLA